MSNQRQSSAPYWLDINHPELFPDSSLALKEPDGLLAVGGDLSEQRLLAAYQQGIFPWYSDEQPILWWTPDPRMVLVPEDLKISRSLRKSIKKNKFVITFDKAFEQVIHECAAPRDYTPDTWITDEMKQAYTRLHHAGHAHSVECWKDDQLVGGLYGISIGQVFFGESMFSRTTDASKIAFVYLVKHLQQWQYKLIDCQVYTEHLESLGAKCIPRNDFIEQLSIYCNTTTSHQWDSTLQIADILEI
jgi:leucyl/phenylalanyl-tRNA--protein transferase